MKVGIYGQSNNKITFKYVNELVRVLSENGIDFIMEVNFYESFKQRSPIKEVPVFSDYHDLDPDLDFFFTVGGDGTFLRSITLIRDHKIPILGINTGRLGFLATVPKESIEAAIEQLVKGEYELKKRALLQVETDQKEDFKGLNFALNEVSVSRKNTASMIKVDTYLDEEFLTTYWSDGLIVSTPTGSTGYSMSCGGPIISPTAKNIVLTPIAPHSLAVRPLVIPLQTQIELQIDSRVDEVLLTLDSRMYTLHNKSKVSIEKANFQIKTVRLTGQSFIKTLREKLLWGEDKRN